MISSSNHKIMISCLNEGVSNEYQIYYRNICPMLSSYQGNLMPLTNNVEAKENKLKHRPHINTVSVNM